AKRKHLAGGKVLGWAGSVDLNHNFFALADGGGAHYNANRLGNAALFADDAAHIAFSHTEVIDDGAVLAGRVNGHPHRVLVFHTAAGDGNQQFLHLRFLPCVMTSYRISACWSSTRTVSVGCAPLASHCFAFSASI